MASKLFGDITGDEQEGGSDATSTGASGTAIDSSMSLIGTRDQSAISRARLRARGQKLAGDLTVDSIANAIKTVESGGNYEAKGASGEYGAYQIMPATWKDWAGDLEQTPENQDKIAKKKLGEWIKQGLTAEQIAAKWNSGSHKGWEKKKGVNKKGVAYDVPAYVEKVKKALGPTVTGSTPTLKNDMSNPISTMQLGKGEMSPEERLVIAHELGIDVEDVPTGPARDRATIAEWGRGVKNAYILADLGMEKGKIGTRIKKGTATPKDTDRLTEINKQMESIAQDAKDSPFVANAFGTLAPFLVESAEKGGKGALIGAMAGGTIAALAGQAGPQAALPEEVITIPAAAAMGARVTSTFMSVENISDIEGGAAYLEMIDMGMDKDKAGIASDFIGTGSGLLEIAQFKMLKRLIPGSDKLASSVVSKAVAKVLRDTRVGRGAGRLVGASIPEAGIETIQEFWGNVVKTVATDIQPELDKTDLSPETKAEYVERLTNGLVETFAVTATGVGVAAVPGVATDIVFTSGNRKAAVRPEPGVTLIPSHGDDKRVDLRDTADDEGRPTVKDLFGVNEKGVEIDEDGATISTDLGITPKQVKDSKQTGASLKSTLENMKLDKSMQRDKIDIENNNRKLETISDLYGQAIIDEDFDEALNLANHYAATVDESANKLDNVVNAKSRRLAKDEVAISPDEINSVQQYKQEKFKQAHGMVSTAVKKAKAAEYTEAMNMQEALESDPKVLKEALTKVERRNKANAPAVAKEARKVKDIIDSREYMSDDTFLEKVAKPEKLLALKADLETRLLDQKEDPNVGSSEQAITQASLRMVDKTLQEKRIFDEAKAERDRIDESRRLQQQNAQRLTSSDKPRVEARKKELGKKATTTELEKRREAVRAKQTETVAKQAAAKEVVKKQEEKTKRPAIQPVAKERLDELKASKARKAAVKKQAEEVAKLDRKPSGLPKKAKVADLKKPEAEYVILTPDNPASTPVSATENRAARAKFTKWLDKEGIDYEVGDHSMFEGTTEKPFILKGVSKKKGKEISDMLKQTSYIHASGEFADLVEGDDVNRISKKDIKVSPDAGDYYTVVAGQKMTMPFFSEKSSSLKIDKAQYQMSSKEVKAAKAQFRSAAIQYKGKIYEGSSHMDIIQNNDGLQEALITMPTHQIHAQFDHGFVTHDGKFTDRMTATKQLGLKEGSYLNSEGFIAPVLKAKAEQMQKDSGIDVPGMEEMTLGEQMGTLEIADAMRDEMKTGKYSWLFKKTVDDLGVETVYVTAPGQYGKNEVIKRFYPDLKSKDDAVRRFEGGLRVDPKTGQMKQAGGVHGVYIKADPMKGNLGGKVFINIPTIARRKKNMDKAMETTVHEHIHGLVDHGIKNLKKTEKAALMSELQEVWDGIPKEFVDETLAADDTHVRVGAGIIQVRRDGVGELITYALAHPEFAAWLNTIPAGPKFRAQSSSIKTIWDKLVSMIAKVAGVPTKLTEVQDVLNRHLKESGVEERFSRETDFDFGANVTPENVKSWTDELDNAAVNALETIVVKDAAEAEKILGYNPGETAVSFWMPATDTEINFGDKKSGMKHTPGRVVLIADRIESQEHAISKWMHEQVGHQGLHNIFPTKHSYESFMEQAYRLFAIKDSKVLEEIQDLYDIGKLQASGKRKLTFIERVHAAEEVIGNRAGTLAPVTKKGLVAKLKRFLSRWLPKVFVGKKNTFKLKDNDVWNIIEMARENVFTGNTQFGELIQKAMDRRAPKVKFQGWETLPPFMEKDETYKQWMKEVRKADPKQVKWYTQHKNTLLKIFGKDADLFNVLLSVTSPNADVETNVIFAAQTYAYLMGAVDKPGALYVNKLQDRIDNHWTSPDAMYRNLESNLFKVTEFVRALMGDPDATVGDMWMYRAFFGDPKSNNQKDEKFSVPQTVAMRQKLHDLASQMSDETGETWTPREVQAAIWVHINAKTNEKGFGEIATYESGLNKPANRFGGKSPLEWLTDLFPNMKDGILGDHIGVKAIPMAPISPLEKKLLGQINTELKAKKSKPGYKVDGEVITITPTENKRLETVRIMRAIVAGGREVTVNDDVTAEWMKKTFGFEETQKSSDNAVTMRLRDDAVGLFTSKTGKVTFGALRNNLGGFSGTYTQEVRFSREAKKNLDQIATLSQEKINEADKDFLRTGNDESSVLFKVHEWRDQSELNMNRFSDGLEQDLLSKFGGRKSKVVGVGSGKLLNTPETELLQKAMNLYIDSGTGNNLEKVMAYAKKVAGMKADNRQKQHLEVINKMLSLSTEEKAWADSNVRPYYAEMLEFAREHNIIDSEVENYVKRQWRMPKELEEDVVTWNGSGNTGFQLTSKSGKQRSFESIIDGWDRGMDLQTDGIISNLQAYGSELGHVFANRRFIKYLRDMIEFKPEGLMFEHNPKTSPDFKKPTGYSKVTVRGFALPGRIIYARNDIAAEINKLGEKSGSAWNSNRWGLRTVRAINSKIKSTILSVSLFHHLAGLRSYMFAVQGSGWKRFRPFKAYKEGLRKLDEKVGFSDPNYAARDLGPIVDLLVREGLTIGKTQDWDESLIQNSIIEDMLSKGTSKASFVALKQWQKARRARRSLTGGLFNRLFAGLKAESASIELMHRLKNIEKKQNGEPATDAQIKLAAQQTAAIINADFGGLHLQRLGRNPNTQKALQMIMLAPDWTESNWRTVVGAMPFAGTIKNKLDKGKLTQQPEGMTKIYRKFWLGAAARSVLSVALAQAGILAMFGDDDDHEEYWDFVKTNIGSWKNFSKGRWISLDFTPLARKLGIGDPNKRQVFSVLGHFKDILKLANIRSLFKHKISPAGRVFETLWDGTDWKGSGFTTAKELIETGQLVRDSKFDGEAAGLEVWATLPSIIGYNIRQSFPIFGSEILQAAQKETTWMAASARMVGLDVRDVSARSGAQIKFEDLATEINELERNLKDAQLSKNQKMIAEARRDIKNYPGYNRIKSRIGYTKSRLSAENNKIKAINLKLREGEDLTDREQKKLEDVTKRKQAIYDKAMKVLDR